MVRSRVTFLRELYHIKLILYMFYKKKIWDQLWKKGNPNPFPFWYIQEKHKFLVPPWEMKNVRGEMKSLTREMKTMAKGNEKHGKVMVGLDLGFHFPCQMFYNPRPWFHFPCRVFHFLRGQIKFKVFLTYIWKGKDLGPGFIISFCKTDQKLVSGVTIQ